jgi:Cu(I)/Ag(I) efflux system membrane protein CusA/SilA
VRAGIGWVYGYVVLGAQRTLAELRSTQDWIVRYDVVTARDVSVKLNG